MQNLLIDLLSLSHEVGREDRGLAILGEGNTSVKLSEETFLVKASGTCLGTLKEEDVVECRFSALLPLLDKEGMSDEDMDNALLAARVDAKAKKPSVEAVFHAYFLSLPNVKFVAHALWGAANPGCSRLSAGSTRLRRSLVSASRLCERASGSLIDGENGRAGSEVRLDLKR